MNFQFAKQGASFAGAMAYYCHDKRAPGEARYPDSAERVAWSETRNMLTDRAETATQIMIATAERAPVLKARAGIAATGRRATQPVAAFSLAWHPDEARGLERGEMVRVADAALKVMGLDHCQSVIIAHRDTKHPHVHVVVNRVNPETGRMEKIDPNKVRALDRWAHDYEKARGQIYSPDRAEKYDRMEARRARHPDKADRVRHVEARRQRAEAPDRRESPTSSKDRERPERLSREALSESRDTPDRLNRAGGQERGSEGPRPDEGGTGVRVPDKAVQGPAPAPGARQDRNAEVARARDRRSQGPEVREKGPESREEATSKPGFVDALRQRLERALGRSQGRGGDGDGREGVERASARASGPARALEEGPAQTQIPVLAPIQAAARTSAQDLKVRSDVQKNRHKAEWTGLGRDFARPKAETYAKWRDPIKQVHTQLKAEAKPLWRAQFAEERQAVRDRARMERSFGGRLGLSIAAARDQREVGVADNERGMVRLVLANFLSRDLREATFAKAVERDRTSLGAQLREVGDARIADVKAERAVELAQLRETYGRDRTALTGRQGVERGEVRAAWREVYREKGRDWAPREPRVANPARDRDRQPDERGRGERPVDQPRDGARLSGARPQDGDRAPGRDRAPDEDRMPNAPSQSARPQEAKPSKFGWIDQREQGADRGSKFERSQEAQERAKEQTRDRDKDRDDRER